MASTFTTWADLYGQMLNQLVSGDTTKGEVRTRDTTVTFRSHDDFLRLLNYVERKKDEESGSTMPRTYAGQGGRD